ncbi:SDR family oxidoreductase [Thioalkalivibrio sp. HK1]|uniref:SDR family oxidoreductase n=1 Tax=Thioalkalivibrio sp. HK1 TaxID=1469245 RepID=UPI0004724EC0|nr:SDR family oxidoreductase [Thioalkalivibrio sp. HK1]
MRETILITGGSRGIGAATAMLAAKGGYDVAITYHRDRTAAQAIVDGIEKEGARALALQGDVASEIDVERIFAEVDAEFGAISALVNNAGLLGRQTTLDTMDLDRVQRTLSVNVIGVFLCCRAAVRRMAFRHGGNGGSIVNLSSVAARLGAPREFIDYAASKGAVDTMTIGLANEVADQGIRVNAVRPGLIHTDIHALSGDPDRVEKLKSRVPMARGGDAIEVAKAILWLASKESSYTTASFIDVAGGR